MNRTGIAVVTAALIAATTLITPQVASAQADPAMAAAREETMVVYDLGRFFGYVNAMVTENRALALSSAQRTEFFRIMGEIRAMTRVEPSWAEENLEYLELDVLTPQQLMDVDRRAIEAQSTRTGGTQSGTGTGSTGEGSSRSTSAETSSGSIATYAAGGAFNPIIDESRTIGQGFMALYGQLR